MNMQTNQVSHRTFVTVGVFAFIVLAFLAGGAFHLGHDVKIPVQTIVVTNYPTLAPGQSLNVADSNNTPLFSIRRFPVSNAEQFSLTNTEIFSTNTPVVIQSNGWIIRFK